MSELEAFRIIQGDTGGCGAPSYKCSSDGNRIEEWSDTCEVYDRYDADEVIAEKDAEIAELKKQVHDYAQGLFVIQASAEKELRHSNYKRCVTMAERCDTKGDWYYSLGESFRNRVDFYIKWRDKWLNIAQKFKEAK